MLTTKMAAILSVAVKRIRLFEGPAGRVVPYWGSSACERRDVLAEGDGMSCTVASEYADLLSCKLRCRSVMAKGWMRVRMGVRRPSAAGGARAELRVRNTAIPRKPSDHLRPYGLCPA